MGNKKPNLFSKIGITKGALEKRKLSNVVRGYMFDISNILLDSCKRHDKSYEYGIEPNIFHLIESETNPETIKEYQERLEYVHKRVNPYYPEFHNNQLCNMDMLQLIEFVSHKIGEFDYYNKGERTLDNYTNYVLEGIIVGSELRNIIRNTIRLIVSKSEYMMGITDIISNNVEELVDYSFGDIERTENTIK